MSSGNNDHIKKTIQKLILPKEYDVFEDLGCEELSIPIMMAFKPVTFDKYSYPTHINEIRSILRYADHNFEAEVPGLFDQAAQFTPIGYVNRFTADEKELLEAVRDRVGSKLSADFGRYIKSVTNLLVQIGPFRVMSHIAKIYGKQPLTLFEIGPGAAYIGAMMGLTGHKYLSYDVTQSLYIWQQYMLRAIADENFFDTAGQSQYNPPDDAKIIHLPWWQYVRFLQNCPVQADVVYSNSNLGEMSPLSLKHVLHISRKMLEKSEIGLFIYFSSGMTAQNSVEQIAAAFEQAGYELAMKEPFMAYVIRGRNTNLVNQIFSEGIPFYDPSGRGGSFDANATMALSRKEAPLDLDLAFWNYRWNPPYID
jgi:hypothetical protein